MRRKESRTEQAPPQPRALSRAEDSEGDPLTPKSQQRNLSDQSHKGEQRHRGEDGMCLGARQNAWCGKSFRGRAMPVLEPPVDGGLCQLLQGGLAGELFMVVTSKQSLSLYPTLYKRALSAAS